MPSRPRRAAGHHLVAQNDRIAVHVPKRLRKKPAPAPSSFELAPAEAGELVSVFAPPRWLRDLGRMCWLLLGVFALLAVLGWLLGTTETIVGPVVDGKIVGTVGGP